VPVAAGAARDRGCRSGSDNSRRDNTVILRLPEQLGSIAAVATRVAGCRRRNSCCWSSTRWRLLEQLHSAVRGGGCRLNSDQLRLEQPKLEAAGAARISCYSVRWRLQEQLSSVAARTTRLNIYDIVGTNCKLSAPDYSTWESFRLQPCVHFQCCGGWLSGPARRPGFRSCRWERAGPAFSVGAPVAGRARAGPRAGPARSLLTLRAPGRGFRGFRRWTWGGCGASRPWDAGLRPHCSHPAGSLTVCRVCLLCDCCRAAREPPSLDRGRADGTTPRRRRARLVGSLMAPRLCCAGAPALLCPEQCASQDLVRAVGLIADRSRKRD
jgi:hypothetical protein